MKNIFIILICLAASGQLRAQVTNPGDAAKNGATDHANTDISNSVDNSLNKTENSIKGLFKKKKKPADATQTNSAGGRKPSSSQWKQ